MVLAKQIAKQIASVEQCVNGLIVEEAFTVV